MKGSAFITITILFESDSSNYQRVVLCLQECSSSSSPSEIYTVKSHVFAPYYSVFFNDSCQAAVHLGDLWDGDIERRPTGGDVQSSDRENQHQHQRQHQHQHLRLCSEF